VIGKGKRRVKADDKPVKTLKDLDAWKKALDFAESIYTLTARFPKEEQFGLISQLRRSAVSVPSNIAEGAARSTRKEFIQFLHVALGSLAEAETQLILARRLDYQVEDTIFNNIENIRRMLLGLIRFLRK
jgi:four helix bundle protein